MVRLVSLFLALLALAACQVGQSAQSLIGPDGRPVAQIYRINAADTAEIQFRMLDGVNSLRQAAGRAPLTLDAQLNAAAATHSRDMFIQNRPWHFGSDGSSPLDRVRRVGFTGRLIGETISETFETELDTLAAWMEQPDAREVILDAEARLLGFAWFQEENGKIWWTMVLGAPGGPTAPGAAANTSAPR